MRRIFLLLLFFLPGLLSFAQVSIPIGTFNSGGGVTGSFFPATTIPTYFGSLGQPLALPRAIIVDSGGGVMVAANLMFGGASTDIIPPVIAYDSTPPPSVSLSALTTITAVVTDNVGLSAARLYWRPILGGDFNQETLDTITGMPNGFKKIIAVQDPMGVEFYFKAFDAANVTTDPPTGHHYAYTTYTNPQVTASLLSHGDQATNYRIISVPFTIAGNAEDVFTDLPQDDPKVYRLWQYTNGNWVEYPDFQTIDRGKGYFIIIKPSTVELKLGLSQIAPTNNRSQLFKMTLSSEWNLIGNPYPTAIDWTNVLALNGNPPAVATELMVYGSGGYTAATTLPPYQGAFVKVTGSPPSNFQIGFGDQTAVGGREAKVSSDLASSVWELPLMLKQGDLQNSLAGIGMRPESLSGLDRFDRFNPPAVSDHVEFLASRAELKVNDLTKDIVTTQGTYVWKFEANSNLEQDVDLSWDNTHFGNNDIPLYLYDVGRNEVIDMRDQHSHRFSPGISRQFKIYYGIPISEISPDVLLMNAPFPNPFKESAEFRFALPGVNESYQVQLDLFSTMGQRVRTVVRGTYPSGRHTATWNGIGDDNEKVASGLYFFKLTVEGKDSRVWDGRLIFTR